MSYSRLHGTVKPASDHVDGCCERRDAGCRPEYMPVLIGMTQIMGESRFRIGNLISTPGWEPLFILNGPIIKELGFNYESA